MGINTTWGQQNVKIMRLGDLKVIIDMNPQMVRKPLMKLFSISYIPFHFCFTAIDMYV